MLDGSKWRIIGAAFIVVMVAVGAFAFNIPGFGKFKKVTAKNGVVSIPVASVSDGKAHYFAFAEGDKEIHFFVVKAKDGSFKTAFDACDVCYEEKKGYKQEGDVMICNQCNKKFATDRIGPSSTGGCNPSYLPSTLAGNALTIKAEDLKKGARFF